MSNLALVENWNQPSTRDFTEQRFTAVASNYENDLRRYAYWLSGDHHIAEDLVQETLMRAWKAFDKLQDEKAAKGWLFTILRRENARRFERKQLQQSDMALEDIGSQETSYDTSTEAFVLRRAIDALPDEYREPLVLKVIGGYSQQEIAEHLGISSAGVGTRLFRAKGKLRDAIAA